LRVDIFIVILDSLSAELERRKQAYARFTFLPVALALCHLAANLRKAYFSNLEVFHDEMVRFSGH